MKKLLLTLLCVIATAASAFADVTYEPVALSDLESGDEVVMVGAGNGNLYFATPTITNSTLTCIYTPGDVSEPVSLTDEEDGQIQKFIITTGSTISLRKSDTDNTYLSTGSSSGVAWATGEAALTPTDAPAGGGGVLLKNGTPSIGFHKTSYVFAAGRSTTNYSGIYFFKEKAEELPVIPAGVTYKNVALSDLESGDEVIMVGAGNGNLYFATPTITNSTLTCIYTPGDVSEPITLTDEEDGQIQKFIITTGSTISLRKSDTDNTYLSTGSSSGVAWATGEAALTPTDAPAGGGGVLLKNGTPSIGFHKTSYVFAAGRSTTNYSGIYFFKKEAGGSENPTYTSTTFTVTEGSSVKITNGSETLTLPDNDKLYGSLKLTPGEWTITPVQEGYEISSIEIDGTAVTLTDAQKSSYTFTVEAGKEPKAFTISTEKSKTLLTLHWSTSQVNVNVDKTASMPEIWLTEGKGENEHKVYLGDGEGQIEGELVFTANPSSIISIDSEARTITGLEGGDAVVTISLKSETYKAADLTFNVTVVAPTYFTVKGPEGSSVSLSFSQPTNNYTEIAVAETLAASPDGVEYERNINSLIYFLANKYTDPEDENNVFTTNIKVTQPDVTQQPSFYGSTSYWPDNVYYVSNDNRSKNPNFTIEISVADPNTYFKLTEGSHAELWKFENGTYEIVNALPTKVDLSNKPAGTRYYIVASDGYALEEVNVTTANGSFKDTNFGTNISAFPGNYWDVTQYPIYSSYTVTTKETEKPINVDITLKGFTTANVMVMSGDEMVIESGLEEGSATSLTNLPKDTEYYIVAKDETQQVISVVGADGAELKLSEGAPFAEGVKYFKFNTNDAQASYTVTNGLLFEVAEGSNVELWAYNGATYKTDVNLVAGKNYVDVIKLKEEDNSDAYIVGAEGNKLTKVVSGDVTKTSFSSRSEFPAPGTYFQFQPEYPELTGYTGITTEKYVEPTKVAFQVTEGSKVVLMHENGTGGWAQDQAFDATSATQNVTVTLSDDVETYYIFASDGYELTEVLGDNDEEMTIKDCEEFMPQFATNCVEFATENAPSQISITATKKEVVIDPDAVVPGQQISFKFDDSSTIDMSQLTSTNWLNIGKEMMGDGGAVVMTVGGTNCQYVPDQYFQVYKGGKYQYPQGMVYQTGEITLKFTDEVSSFEKIEFVYANDQKLDCGNVGSMNEEGTVWTATVTETPDPNPDPEPNPEPEPEPEPDPSFDAGLWADANPAVGEGYFAPYYDPADGATETIECTKEKITLNLPGATTTDNYADFFFSTGLTLKAGTNYKFECDLKFECEGNASAQLTPVVALYNKPEDSQEKELGSAKNNIVANNTEHFSVDFTCPENIGSLYLDLNLNPNPANTFVTVTNISLTEVTAEQPEPVADNLWNDATPAVGEGYFAPYYDPADGATETIECTKEKITLNLPGATTTDNYADFFFSTGLTLKAGTNYIFECDLKFECEGNASAQLTPVVALYNKPEDSQEKELGSAKNNIVANNTEHFSVDFTCPENIGSLYLDLNLNPNPANTFVTVSNISLTEVAAAPAAAPAMHVVRDANGKITEVTFTPAGSSSVNIKTMYVTYTGPELPTGIETIEASANDAEAVYYNLQGVRVQNPAAGIYIRVRGNEADKVLVK